MGISGFCRNVLEARDGFDEPLHASARLAASRNKN